MAVLDDEVLVEHRSFSLVDADREWWAAADASDAGSDIVGCVASRAWFRSRANDHYAAVRVELWSSAPAPPAAGQWDTSGKGVLDVRGRRLCLATTVNGPVLHAAPSADTTGGLQPRYLELPGPGSYELRAHVRRSAEASDLPEATYRHDVEAWLVRLWPVSPPEGGPSRAG